MKTYTGYLKSLPANGIFVFGSNTQGRHGAGAALSAVLYFGAFYGQAAGRQGQSYAIVTKDLTKDVHPSINEDHIINQIYGLYDYARRHPDLDFYIAYSGTGVNLNGYSNEGMAEMFTALKHITRIPENIIFEEEFAKLLTP